MQRTAFALAVFCACCAGSVFPTPREVSPSGSDFVLDSGAAIAIPAHPSEEDLFLAGFLRDELSDRWGVHIRIQPGGGAAKRVITIVSGATHALAPEGYTLRSSAESVVISGADDRGAFYGLQSLRQLIRRDAQGRVVVEGV